MVDSCLFKCRATYFKSLSFSFILGDDKYVTEDWLSVIILKKIECNYFKDPK